MDNKVYDKIKKFIKNYYKFIIEIALLVFLFNYEMDYEIYTYGKPIEISNRIEVENAYSSEGGFYLTYVQARPGLIPFVLLSQIIPSWDLVSLDENRIENESSEEILKRGKIDLETVNEYAIKNAFEEAGIPYKEENLNITVYYIFENADTNLEVGDIIKTIDGKAVKTSDELIETIKNKNIGDKVFFEIIRDNKTMDAYGVVQRVEEENIIGMYLVPTLKIVPTIKVKFNYNSNESGPSGGLMSTLEIYNQLTENDITKGKKIAGTGTIKYDGEVGGIGGVKYKLQGAVKDKADVFIVPSENYEEAKKLKKENNYDIKLIEAINFKQVLEELENL